MPLIAGRGFVDASLKNDEVVINAVARAAALGNDERRRAPVPQSRANEPRREQPSWTTVAGVVDDAATVALADRAHTAGSLSDRRESGDGYGGVVAARRECVALFQRPRCGRCSSDLDAALPPATPVAVSELSDEDDRDATLHDDAAHGVRRHSDLALGDRPLRRDRVHGQSTHARDRYSHRAWRRGARTFERLVLSRGLALAAAGLVLGIGGAVAGARVLRGTLYGVTPTDPVSFAIGALALLGIAALACIAPMRRAVRIDPVTAMRSD